MLQAKEVIIFDRSEYPVSYVHYGPKVSKRVLHKFFIGFTSRYVLKVHNLQARKIDRWQFFPTYSHRNTDAFKSFDLITYIRSKIINHALSLQIIR